MSLVDETFALDFDVAKSIRYHAYRRSFWDGISNLSKILTIVSGTAVLITLVGEMPFYSKILAIVVAITSASDVVLGFSSKARDHDGLYRAFSRLAQDISETLHPKVAELHEWRRRRLEIEMDEPGIFDLLERRCSAEEAAARGCKIEPAWKLNRFEIYISQIAFWPSIRRLDPAPPQ